MEKHQRLQMSGLSSLIYMEKSPAIVQVKRLNKEESGHVRRLDFQTMAQLLNQGVGISFL